jgi:hypothetical protein
VPTFFNWWFTFGFLGIFINGGYFKVGKSLVLAIHSFFMHLLLSLVYLISYRCSTLKMLKLEAENFTMARLTRGTLLCIFASEA